MDCKQSMNPLLRPATTGARRGLLRGFIYWKTLLKDKSNEKFEFKDQNVKLVIQTPRRKAKLQKYRVVVFFMGCLTWSFCGRILGNFTDRDAAERYFNHIVDRLEKPYESVKEANLVHGDIVRRFCYCRGVFHFGVFDADSKKVIEWHKVTKKMKVVQTPIIEADKGWGKGEMWRLRDDADLDAPGNKCQHRQEVVERARKYRKYQDAVQNLSEGRSCETKLREKKQKLKCKQKLKYNLFTLNCETFALACKYGESLSMQSVNFKENVCAILTVTTPLGLVLAGCFCFAFPWVALGFGGAFTASVTTHGFTDGLKMSPLCIGDAIMTGKAVLDHAGVEVM